MKREQKMGLIGFGIASLFLISPVFQNCAKVNYQTTEPVPAGATTSTAAIPTRKLTVDPTFNQTKSDMKVLLVVDDSYSMSQSQIQLANAIDSLLNPLQGHNVEFKIVSTSGVPSNEVDYSITNKYFSDQNIEIPEAQVTQMGTYTVERNIKNAVLSRHGLLKLYRESTSSQFEVLKTQIKDAIRAVGVSGSETEEGLCATVRQIYDETSSRFFKPGDKAAVVILTDENDSSAFNRCSRRYRQRISAKPVVYYNYGQQRAKISLEYQLNRDGVTTWQAVVWGVGLQGPHTINVGDTCTSEDQANSLSRLTSQGYIIRNVTGCVYEVVQASYYGADLGDDGSTADKNLCHSTTYFNNQVFANFYAMVNALGLSAAAGSCGKQIIPGNTISDQTEFDSIVKSDSVATSTQDLKLAILNQSNTLFGTNGYIFAHLIRLSGESCPLVSGQSYGVKYQELSELLGANKSVVQSLCNTNFSSALAQVSQFIVTEASNSFVLPLQEGEFVLSVTVIRNGTRTSLTTSNYEAVKGAVTLMNYPLIKGDTLEFELGPH